VGDQIAGTRHQFFFGHRLLHVIVDADAEQFDPPRWIIKRGNRQNRHFTTGTFKASHLIDQRDAAHWPGEDNIGEDEIKVFLGDPLKRPLCGGCHLHHQAVLFESACIDLGQGCRVLDDQHATRNRILLRQQALDEGQQPVHALLLKDVRHPGDIGLAHHIHRLLRSEENERHKAAARMGADPPAEVNAGHVGQVIGTADDVEVIVINLRQCRGTVIGRQGFEACRSKDLTDHLVKQAGVVDDEDLHAGYLQR